jgi:Virulence protein RhuM family
MDNAEIIIYTSDKDSSRIEVRVEAETIWLTQAQIVTLFSTSKANVSEHIKQIYQSGELEARATVRKFRIVQIEGSRSVTRNIDHFNLDMIISIGYRVNSIRGTQFRIWANRVLQEYLLKGYAVNQRLERIEHKIVEHDQKFELLIKTALPPHEGIFYDGQIFDAYKFVSDLVKSATNSIVLIDNYVDESVLTLLSKKHTGVKATIYTATVSGRLKLDIKKFNAQYQDLEVKTFTRSHDRFLIIDNTTVYHIGASLKDLGKKWFAFSKIKLDANEMLNKLEL